MIKNFFILTLGAIFLYANEISVFGAGNLDSKNPYGLTKTEEHILKNKKELGSIDSKVKGVKTEIELVNERIDGLESLYEGDSKKLNDTVIKLNQSIKDIETNTNLTLQNKESIDQNKESINNIKNVVDQLMLVQEESAKSFQTNIDLLKKSMDNLASLINEINQNYVSNKNMQENMQENMAQFLSIKDFNKFKKDLIKDLEAISKVKTVVVKDKKGKKKSKKEVYEEAKDMVEKNYLTKSIPLWEYLIEKNYKPAESNFQLGNIWYFKAEYNKAIKHFKTSAMLYDKGWWMPKLLLHSAISFEKINDIENASNFYSTLIEIYPDSKEAKEAKKNLK